MRRGRDQHDDHDQVSSASIDAAPGRRSVSEGLPVQRRASLDAGLLPPVLASSATAAAGEDPFAMHLIGAPVQRAADGTTPHAGVDIQDAAARGVAGPGASLPHLDAIQRSFGRHDVGEVVAHTDGAAQASAQVIGAQAYATGNQIAFAGAPDLHTAAHEAAHVVQQRAGVHLKGGVGEAGDSYEQHADAVADAVVAGQSAEALLDRHAGSGGPAAGLQLKREVFSTAAFGNPTNYLKGDGDENKVVEEPGSQGILGLPDQEAITKLADEAGRDAFIDKLGQRCETFQRRKDRADARALAAAGNVDEQLKAQTESKGYENDIAMMSGMIAGLKRVYDLETAAVFYRQHTLEFSKLGALPKHVHNAGDGAHATHTFHKDAGLVVVNPATLHGGNAARKATLLNGPWGTGFVRGHNTIKNMKHRFIDHVHVDKDDEEHGIDIYNTNDEARGATAQAYLATANEADGLLHGHDTKAIDTQIGEINDADIAELKRIHDE